MGSEVRKHQTKNFIKTNNKLMLMTQYKTLIKKQSTKEASESIRYGKKLINLTKESFTWKIYPFFQSKLFIPKRILSKWYLRTKSRKKRMIQLFYQKTLWKFGNFFSIRIPTKKSQEKKLKAFENIQEKRISLPKKISRKFHFSNGNFS